MDKIIHIIHISFNKKPPQISFNSSIFNFVDFCHDSA